MTKQADDINKSEYIAIGIAILIVLSLMSASTLFPYNQSSASTPEDTLNNYMDNINDHDARGALDLTIYAFADQWWYIQILHWLQDWFNNPSSKSTANKIHSIIIFGLFLCK